MTTFLRFSSGQLPRSRKGGPGPGCWVVKRILDIQARDGDWPVWCMWLSPRNVVPAVGLERGDNTSANSILEGFNEIAMISFAPILR